MMSATRATALPEPKYAHQRPIRSAIQPPATHPTALITPFKMPVTKATLSGPAFQSGATADQTFHSAGADWRNHQDNREQRYGGAKQAENIAAEDSHPFTQALGRDHSYIAGKVDSRGG